MVSPTSGVPVPEQIVTLNVGGHRFVTSSHTLTWIPDTFFTSLLSGRIPTVRDDSGAIFIDRDPEVFRVILNYLRTKQVDLTAVSPVHLKHEAQFFNLSPLVRRLTLCEELEVSSCGSVLFHALIPPPDLPFERAGQKELTGSTSTTNSPSSAWKKAGSADRMACGDSPSMVHSGFSSPKMYGHYKKSSWEWNRYLRTELTMAKQQLRQNSEDECDPLRVRVIKAHYSTVVVGYAYYACVYKMKESIGWQTVYITSRMESTIKHVALNTKFGAQNTDRVLAVALANHSIHLWCLGEDGDAQKKGTFSLGVQVDKLFFIGSQMVALSKTGKVGIWQSVNHNWQVQDLVPISCYDTAGSSLLLGCTNGSMYYIDMQKFPLRMKDNDLLITELYRDPSGDCITAISVYLTPKTTVCGNWIEIAYGTSSGAVRVIVQHPETVGHGPQLFQTYTVHNSPITKVALNTSHLISVCSEYNHVRSWAVTRFRGMISTQPGSTSLASFKVLTLDSTDDSVEKDYTDVGPFGDQDGDQMFVQRVVPDANQVFVRLASTGDRVCTIKTVDNSPISAFAVHECEGSSRVGSRPRRYLFCGTTAGNIQMWDLTTALDRFASLRSSPSSTSLNGPCQNQAEREQVKPPIPTTLKTPSTLMQGLTGPTPQELLQLIDECDICCNSLANTPCDTPNVSATPSASATPNASATHLPGLDFQKT